MQNLISTLIVKAPFAGGRTFILALLAAVAAAGLAMFHHYAMAMVLFSVSAMVFYLRVAIAALQARVNDIAIKLGLELDK